MRALTHVADKVDLLSFSHCKKHTRKKTVDSTAPFELEDCRGLSTTHDIFYIYKTSSVI